MASPVSVCLVASVHGLGSPEFTWPLVPGNLSVELYTGRTSGSPPCLLDSAPRHPDLDFLSHDFRGSLDSYVDLRLTEDWITDTNFDFVMLVYPFSRTGTIFHYKMDNADQATKALAPLEFSDVFSQVRLYYNETAVIAELWNLTSLYQSITVEYDLGANQEWVPVAVGYDRGAKTMELDIGPQQWKLTDATKHTLGWPGTLRVGRGHVDNMAVFKVTGYVQYKLEICSSSPSVYPIT